MTTLLAVAAGGALGASARYATSVWARRVFGEAYAFSGTLIVNVVGSLIMGFVAAWLLHRVGSERFVPFLMTGVLGGFTTFSAFSLDAVMLYEKGRVGMAAAYMGGSVALSIAALALGMAIARAVGGVQ